MSSQPRPDHRRQRQLHALSRYGLQRILPPVIFLLSLHTGMAYAADTPPPATQNITSSRIVSTSEAMNPATMRKLAPNDEIELSNGKRLRVSELRRLGNTSRQLSAPENSRLPQALRLQAAATGTPVNDAKDLARSLQRADSDTLVLPSGKRVTVGLVRLLQPQIEKRSGRKLGAAALHTGPVVQITAQTDWESVLKKPDDTILEAPGGTRTTVGAVKQALADGTTSATPATRPARRGIQP